MKIGYLRQTNSIDLSQSTATVLHTSAIVRSLQAAGHQVRTITVPHGQIRWSDDWEQWHSAESNLTDKRFYRLFESSVRGVQSRLKLPYFNLFNSFRFSRDAVAALRGYDILYERSWFTNTGGLMTARALGVPLVLEINGDLEQEYRDLDIQLSRREWAAVRFVHRRLLHGADHLVTVSEPLRQRMIDRWDVAPQRVTTVPNGAHVDLFAELEIRRDSAEPTIAFVGSFKPWHGLDMLVNAFADVHERHPASRLLLIGDGPQREAVAAHARSRQLNGEVVFTGQVPHDDVPALLDQADITVISPQVSDASTAQSPLKLYEYMAAGKAVIAPATDTFAL